NDITPLRVRDFVARWYVEEASALKADSETGDLGDNPAAKDHKRATYSRQPLNLPSPIEFLNELALFFKWMDVQTGVGEAAGCLAILNELRETLPRAIEINHALTESFRGRRSAFNFPEFLTSFEEGGSSQYDIDAPGNIGAIDGFFRIIRVEGSLVEAQEVISDELTWPIVFPAEIAPMLNDAYVINLELVRARGSWQIAGCGFTYPPGTEF